MKFEYRHANEILLWFKKNWMQRLINNSFILRNNKKNKKVILYNKNNCPLVRRLLY